MFVRKMLYLASQYLVPHHLLSRIFGFIAACQIPFVKNAIIKAFIRYYNVDMREALISKPADYRNFNDFFSRRLKKAARVVEYNSKLVICPTDGTVSEIGRIRQNHIVQAKKHGYNVVDLLGGNAEDAASFINGSFVTIYLAPGDYHRVHMPIKGKLQKTTHVKGKLFSVNPLAVRYIPSLFARNERLVCFFETEYGPMVIVMVGAMIVASIETTWDGSIDYSPKNLLSKTFYHPHILLERGEEMGFFRLGSTVILLFGPCCIDWSSKLMQASTVKMGQIIGYPK